MNVRWGIDGGDVTTLVLRGGTISENVGDGVTVFHEAQITAAKAEQGRPQTISKDNDCRADERYVYAGHAGGYDWHAQYGGEIIGIPEEKVNLHGTEEDDFYMQ